MRLTVSLPPLLAGVSLLGSAPLPKPRPPVDASVGAEATRVLDTRRADYLEDGGTHRHLANLELRLLTTDEAAVLHLQVSAVGPTVEPGLGFRGVHGANHITARELDTLQ